MEILAIRFTFFPNNDTNIITNNVIYSLRFVYSSFCPEKCVPLERCSQIAIRTLAATFMGEHGSVGQGRAALRGLSVRRQELEVVVHWGPPHVKV